MPNAKSAIGLGAIVAVAIGACVALESPRTLASNFTHSVYDAFFHAQYKGVGTAAEEIVVDSMNRDLGQYPVHPTDVRGLRVNDRVRIQRSGSNHKAMKEDMDTLGDGYERVKIWCEKVNPFM